MTKPRTADSTDRAILRVLRSDPDATLASITDRTGLARNTVRARLTRYREEGVLRELDRRIAPGFLGYPMRAFIVATVTQRLLTEIGKDLEAVPEVVEVIGLTGVTDLLIQVVAKDADDLYRVAGRILDINGIERTATGLAMREIVHYRLGQLLAV